jgi:hypothetical protein
MLLYQDLYETSRSWRIPSRASSAARRWIARISRRHLAQMLASIAVSPQEA